MAQHGATGASTLRRATVSRIDQCGKATYGSLWFEPNVPSGAHSVQSSPCVFGKPFGVHYETIALCAPGVNPCRRGKNENPWETTSANLSSCGQLIGVILLEQATAMVCYVMLRALL